MTVIETPAPTPSVYPNSGTPAHDDAPDHPRLVSVMTVDDRLSLYGSMIGSLALVWLLYTRILPFSGKVGFVICWYAVYLVMFATVTAMAHSLPIVIDRLWSAIVTGGAALVGVALFSTVIYTIVKGFAAVHHVSFLTHSQAGVSPTAPLNQGGVWHAIVGSLIELGIATLVSLPLGIGTAVYMVEVGGKFARVVRTVVEAMTALPDILAGLFIYTTLIVGLGFQRGGFCAAMALSVMMLPIIARSADVALRVVPGGLREAGLALGASQWQTVRRVVLPTCRSGLATAVILGMARAIGETAPVLIASGASTFFNTNPFNNPMNSLPLYILTAVRSGEPRFIARGFGAGIVLLALVMILFGVARFLSRSKAVSR
jgi:phosphate transport system permease protein